MNKDKMFKERQVFEDKMVLLFLIGGILLTLYDLFRSFSQRYVSVWDVVAHLVVVAVFVALLWGLNRLRLKVSINEKRIKYKFFPLHKKAHKIPWEEVASCQVVRTSPLAQWHGSNIRFREYWYSLTGRNGLSIETKDGKRFFIGCKNVDDLVETLDDLSIG